MGIVVAVLALRLLVVTMPSKDTPGGTVTDYDSWPEKVVLEKSQQTALACIRGVRSESEAREWLGCLNAYGVEGRLREAAIRRVRELSD